MVPRTKTTLVLVLGLVAGAVSQARATITSYLLTPTADGHYTATQIGTSIRITSLGGLNNKGQVVGDGASYPVRSQRAFVWDLVQGTRDLGVLGSDGYSTAYGINDQGQVVGISFNSAGHHAFIWDETDGMREWAGIPSEAYDINNAGQMTGTIGNPYKPCIWTATGEVQVIGSFDHGSGRSINNVGQVVGDGTTAAVTQTGWVTHAFLWSASEGLTDLGVLPGCGYSVAEDVNDSGQVVGRCGGMRAFLWTAGNGMQELPYFGFEAQASGINNAGIIVGSCARISGSVQQWHAAIWQDGSVKDLNELLASDVPHSYPLSYARSINDSGQILAAYDSSLSPPLPPPPPTITQQPQPQIVCMYGTATFTVAATGDGTLTYQWQKDSANLYNGGHYWGVMTATLTVWSVDDTDLAAYRCVVSNAGGSTSSNEAILSLSAQLPTTITSQPQSQTIDPGGSATFSVGASGDGELTYQWQGNGADVSDGAHYSGATTPTLTIFDAGPDEAGGYHCVVTGGCGSVTSYGAMLIVNPPMSRRTDLDPDGDVDLTDFAMFQMCFSGPNYPPPYPACEMADFDRDSDVDLADFSVFQACFNGDNHPPACQ